MPLAGGQLRGPRSTCSLFVSSFRKALGETPKAGEGLLGHGDKPQERGAGPGRGGKRCHHARTRERLSRPLVGSHWERAGENSYSEFSRGSDQEPRGKAASPESPQEHLAGRTSSRSSRQQQRPGPQEPARACPPEGPSAAGRGGTSPAPPPQSCTSPARLTAQAHSGRRYVTDSRACGASDWSARQRLPPRRAAVVGTVTPRGAEASRGERHSPHAWPRPSPCSAPSERLTLAAMLAAAAPPRCRLPTAKQEDQTVCRPLRGALGRG